MLPAACCLRPTFRPFAMPHLAVVGSPYDSLRFQLRTCRPITGLLTPHTEHTTFCCVATAAPDSSRVMRVLETDEETEEA